MRELFILPEQIGIKDGDRLNDFPDDLAAKLTHKLYHWVKGSSASGQFLLEGSVTQDIRDTHLLVPLAWGVYIAVDLSRTILRTHIEAIAQTWNREGSK